LDQENDVLPRGLRFDVQYLLGQTPWDTGVTPPEVKAFVETHDAPPGRAVDLGCGTGKNAVYLARQGWRAVGIDISLLAILQARWRTLRTEGTARFYRADVTNLLFLERPFDLVLDIGCLHSLPARDRTPYASELIRLTRSGSWYMLYAFLPRDRQGVPAGIAPKVIKDLFTPAFDLERQKGGEDPTGPSSAWYWLRRR
jgi:SAM-dependent methyltransferase